MSRKKSRKRKKFSYSSNLVDIVLNIYGEEEFLPRCLDAIPEAAGDVTYRVIAVDNASPGDGIWDILRGRNDVAKVRLKENVGYPGGMNAGFIRGSAPLVVFLTADVFLYPGAIENMIRTMDDPDIGVAAGKWIFPDDPAPPHSPPGTIQHAGMAFNIQGKPFHIFIGWSPDHPKVNEKRDMAAVTGACFITRRRLFKTIGGFNEAYGKGTYEDVEYCFSVREHGLRVVYDPSIEGEHYAGGSLIKGAGKGGNGFDIFRNESIFKARFAHMLVWDEWRYW